MINGGSRFCRFEMRSIGKTVAVCATREQQTDNQPVVKERPERENQMIELGKDTAPCSSEREKNSECILARRKTIRTL